MVQDRMGQPLSARGLFSCYIQDLTRSVARMAIRRTRRTKDQVESEYHAGHWQRMRVDRPWIQFSDLTEFIVGSDRQLRIAKACGQVVEIATDEYYRLRLSALEQVMAVQAGDVDELVELGCGFGYNLFSLALANRWQVFTGFDISENGIAAARDIASHFGFAESMQFGLLDLTDPNHANFSQITGKTVFTCFCIEQVPKAVELVISNIIAQCPKRVIHIEPTTELLKFWRPMDLLNLVYVKSVDYQSHLFTVLGAMEARRKIRILDKARMDWAPTIHNDGFMITWEPV